MPRVVVREKLSGFEALATRLYVYLLFYYLYAFLTLPGGKGLTGA